ncbi:Cytochrome P450 CYP82J17 [Linum perenne]
MLARKLGAFADKHGPMFTIRLGSYSTVVVSDEESMKDCFVKNDRALAARPPSTQGKILGKNFAVFGFASYGDYWRNVKKLIITEILSLPRIRAMRHVQVSEVNVLVSDLYSQSLMGPDGRAQVVISDWLQNFVLNIITRMVAGMKKSMKRISKELDVIIDGWIVEHKVKRSKLGENLVPEDFIDVMLSVIDDSFDPSATHDKDTIIKSTAMDRIVQDSDLENLTYLHAVIRETLRMNPAGPISVPRVASEDITIRGYHVPKGTRFFANFWKLHRNPEIFTEPNEFRPERFHDKEVKVDIYGRDFEYLPFGTGRRSCPGMNFGMEVVQLTAARLLQAFDFGTPLDLPVDMTEADSTTLAKEKPLEVVLRPRLSPHLYTLN